MNMRQIHQEPMNSHTNLDWRSPWAVRAIKLEWVAQRYYGASITGNTQNPNGCSQQSALSSDKICKGVFQPPWFSKVQITRYFPEIRISLNLVFPLYQCRDNNTACLDPSFFQKSVTEKPHKVGLPFGSGWYRCFCVIFRVSTSLQGL